MFTRIIRSKTDDRSKVESQPSRSDSISNYGDPAQYHHELGEVDPDHILDELAREKGHADFMALVDKAAAAQDKRAFRDDILGILYVAGGALSSAGLAAKGIIDSAGAKALASKLGWSSASITSAAAAGSAGSAASSAVGSAAGIAAANSASSKSSQDDDSLLGTFKRWIFGDVSDSSQPSFLSGLLSGLGGIGTEIGSSVLNYQNQVKLIDKQNAYNTPAAQMQRFADAGLNPNLIYGMGSNGNQPQAGSVAPVDFSTAQREAKMSMLQYKADLAQKQSYINLMDKQAADVDESKKAKELQNSVFMQTWFNDQWVKLQQIRESVARINNDNKRVELEKQLNDAEISLKKAQENSRSPLGQWGHDMIFFMQQFNGFMNQFDTSTPDWASGDSYSVPVPKAPGVSPVVPPGFNGR